MKEKIQESKTKKKQTIKRKWKKKDINGKLPGYSAGFLSWRNF